MSVSELVEGVRIPAPVTVSRSDSVLLLGTLLSSWDVPSAIIADGSEIAGMVYGHELVAYLINRSKKEILKGLLQPIGQVMERLSLPQVSTVGHKDRFESVLNKIAENRSGGVVVTNEGGQPVGILSLSEIIRCLALRNKKAPVKVRAVSSPLKLATEEQSLSEALSEMKRNGTRRAIIKRDDVFYGLTDREIVKAFFSYRGLTCLAEDAKGFQSSTLGELADGQARLLPNVGGEVNVHEAWRHLDGDPRSCLIVDDYWIATPWDLVMKPFLEGRFAS